MYWNPHNSYITSACSNKYQEVLAENIDWLQSQVHLYALSGSIIFFLNKNTTILQLYVIGCFSTAQAGICASKPKVLVHVSQPKVVHYVHFF